MKNNPLANVKLRRAVSMAIDRQKLVAYMRNNLGTPANNGIVPIGMPNIEQHPYLVYSYLPDSAKKIITSFGYTPEKPLELLVTTTTDYLDICEFVQHELSKVNIKLSIDVATGISFRQMVSGSKLAFFRASWLADYPDAENYYALFYSKGFSPDGPNYSHFKDNEYDSLYLASFNTTNIDKRKKIFIQMENILADHVVIIPLFYDVAVRVKNNSVNRMTINPVNALILNNILMQNQSKYKLHF
jgi:ABC-type transport system substrate-binding protein